MKELFKMEPHKHSRSVIRDFILGGQDGLVNVLGIILAVAVATGDIKTVMIAGLAATFAESISMAAVAYTSSKAAKEFYLSEMEREKKEMKEVPHLERKEIYDIYRKKGFRGTLLKGIVKHITSKEKLWLDTMMAEELHLYPDDYDDPVKSAWIVGISAILGSLVPLMPFLFFTMREAIIGSLILSTAVLFVTGAVKARITIGNWFKSGLEMAAVGMTAAILGYFIGAVLGIVIV